MDSVMTIGALLILGISIIIGYHRGFIRTALGILSIVISIALMYILNPIVSQLLLKYTNLYENTAQTIQGALRASLDLSKEEEQQQLQEILEKANLTPEQQDDFRALPEDQQRQMMKEFGLSEAQQKLVVGKLNQGSETKQQLLEKTFLPEALVEQILEDRGEGSTTNSLIDVDGLLEDAGNYIARLVVRVLAAVITFAATYLIIRILFLMGGMVGAVPGIHGVNKLFGGILGGVRGLIVLWLCCMVIVLFAGTAIGQEMLASIETNPFLHLFYKGSLSFGTVVQTALSFF